MSVQFDPKIKGQAEPAQNEEAVSSRPSAVSQEDPQAVISELDLLFRGLSSQNILREQSPPEAVQVPNLEKDIPQVLKKSSPRLQEIIGHYQLLKRNLLERRQNFEKVLKGDLHPAEAMDLYARIEEINRGLLEVEQNIQKALRREKSGV